ncbi:MAG: Gmad2 immunoglobulin-like domain-containing protein [Parcubacteria group bacterium]|nr:Gmad2 immunoglobulin-like domain-containing protein [Parcubacteria group bacterium]
MAKYIFITIILLAAMLGLAYKQAPNEPEVSRPQEDSSQEIIADVPQAEEGEPVISDSGNVRVTQPRPDATITSPMLVKGSAKASAPALHLRLKDASGTVIAEKQATAAAAGEDGFGSFGELLLFENVAADSGVLEAFSKSPFDGSEQDLVSIPIKF